MDNRYGLLFSFCLLFLISCKKELIVVEPIPEILLKVEITEEFIIANQGAWIVLSNLAGQIIQVEEIRGGTNLIFPNHKSIGNDNFHVSLVQKGFYFNDVANAADDDILNVITYSFIEPSVWQISYAEPYIAPRAIHAAVTLKEDDGVIDYSIISGTLSASSNTKYHPRIKMKKEDNRIIVIAHIENENRLRYKILEEIKDGDEIIIKTSELSSTSLSFIDVPKKYEYRLLISALTNCKEECSSFVLQGNFFGKDEKIPTNYILQDSSFFDRYLTQITLSEDQETYELQYLGMPISTYSPTPIDFVIEEKMITNFQLKTSNDFTFYRGVWKFSEIEKNKRNIVTWEVFGNFPSSFIAPNLNEFLPEEAQWFNAKELALEKIQELNYSRYINYQQWKDEQFKFFKPLFFARIIDRDYPKDEELLEIKTLITK